MNAIVLSDFVRNWDAQDGSLLSLKGRSLIFHALSGEHDVAQSLLGELHLLRGRFPGFAAIRDIASGSVPLHKIGSVVYVGNPLDSVSLARILAESTERCAQWLDLPPPQIVLQCMPQRCHLYYTLICFPGLAIIRLSMMPDSLDEVRFIVFQEVCHAFLHCGVRLLDEGLAHYFATHFVDPTHALISQAKYSGLSDIHELLTMNGDGLFGNNVCRDSGDYRAAVSSGAQLIECLINAAGIDHLKVLFLRISQSTSDAEIIELIEATLGHRLPHSARYGCYF